MEHPSNKSDIILGITPKSMIEERGPQRLVFIVVAILGFVLICLGAYILYASNHSWVPEVCIALGVAIASPVILSYMYRRYLLEDIKEELSGPAREFKKEAVELLDKSLSEYRREIDLLQSIHTAGLCGLYPSRREAIGAFLQFLEEENKEILVLGLSLHSLLEEPDKEYEDVRSCLCSKKDESVKIRFLLTHPVAAGLRGYQEGRPLQYIENQILASLEILLNKWFVPPENIKLYPSTPVCFGMKMGKALLLNFYPTEGVGYDSQGLIVQRGGLFYNKFNDAYFRAWWSSRALPVPKDINELEKKLDTFANKIQELMELTRS